MKDGLEIWLAQGKEIQVGPKTLLLLPTPIVKFRNVTRWIDETTKGVLLDALKNGDKDLTPWKIMADVVREVDVAELCMRIFERENPQTGEAINAGIDKKFFEDFLDTPTTQRIIKTFIEVNDFEEAIKNLQRLPMVQSLLEVLKSSFGLPFLTSLVQNMDSNLGTLEGLPSLKSSTTSEGAFTGTPGSGKETEKKLPIM